MTNSKLLEITGRIKKRSAQSRKDYEERIDAMRSEGRARPRLSCGNIAHAIAACSEADKAELIADGMANIAIVSSYNDMLSAHQPYHAKLDQMKRAISDAGAVSQMAGGVPAMCDGVTQGQSGMELSLFSRDVIAMSTAIAMTHNVFDGGMLFGICDKIVPGLLMGALSFGHLPFIFVPAGPMSTGISNTEKVKVRQKYVTGEVERAELLENESKAYHSPGTCTFYGTANSNQMMLEMMGLQLPGSSFVNPDDPLRASLDYVAAETMVNLSNADNKVGLADMVTAESIINGIIGLLATGGSTNHTLHIVAIAARAGIQINWQDFADLSEIIPLLARVYPNGLADVNGFHAAGGTPFVISELLSAGLLHADIQTVLGKGMEPFAAMPKLQDGELVWTASPDKPKETLILRKATDPFQPTGGLAVMKGKLGQAVMKISAVKPENRMIEAPALVFEDQDEMLAAYKAGKLERDFVGVIRFQGPKANGMPELHKLTPSLGVLQDKGFKVALVTDGRMSGASGKVPSAIHVSPEAASGGMIAKIQDGDMIRLDPENSMLDLMVDDDVLNAREPSTGPSQLQTYGRDLFETMRNTVATADVGGSVF